ncbi:ABC transporter permease [Propionivibrio limicola]|uniref:ABC transporter permease n=1 Tax=Propionivibrio limicola TaxID=167645 RepID=UPI0012928017|nr:FtsX-like permease family protein [Propionivibrio limicola]
MNHFSFILKMLRREGSSGELHLLAAALVIAVAALTAVGFFTDRVRQALTLEANQLIGADLVLTSDHPWSTTISDEVKRRGLENTETRTFPSMVTTTGGGDLARAQLAEIKAVSEGYPLRGNLRIAPQLYAPDAVTKAIPLPGAVWIDERLAAALEARVGDVLSVGRSNLRVSAVLTLEPDRGVNFFSVAPRLLMNLTDIEATALIQPGSRVSYRLLVAGEYNEIKKLRSIVYKLLEHGARVEDSETARPEIRSALERAQRFLGLAALLTVVLAAVAVSLASRRYMQRHLDSCAIMRCLGATQGALLGIHAGQFVVLGVVACVVGAGIGYVAHFALYAWLAHLLATPLPGPGWLPLLQGVLTGLLLLMGFSLPPLFQLKNVSTLRVLRRELVSGTLPFFRLFVGYAIGLAALAGLMFWVAGELRLGSYVVGGFSLAMVVFATVARLSIRLLNLFRHGSGKANGHIGWRYGFASLERRSGASVIQIVALSLGFMALLLLTVTRNDLLSAWQAALPPEAPNRFAVNIQPEQLAGVRQFYASSGLHPEFSPMVRGRLIRVNGIEVSPSQYDDDRAKRLVEREFNLSYRLALPEGNAVTAGRWFGEVDEGQGIASVEEGLANRLGLRVGDRLEFNIAGDSVEVRIVGLRKLNWDSMRVNFFVLTPPKVLERYPASWITSFYLAPERTDFVNRLIREFPNLTVIDVAAIVRQLQSILDQVARAVQFIFLFTLAAGIVVLYAALASAAEERRYELAVMRALGARREQLRRALLAEFAAVGALSGLIAALGASAIGQALASKAFQLEVGINLWLMPAAMAGGAVVVMAAGWFAAARLISTPPLEALRVGV